MAAVTINDLLEAGVHFGHQTKRWNPKMKPYIYGSRNGISIFDLTVTINRLAEACEFLRQTAADGGTILLVGSKRQAQEVIREAAERTGMPRMCNRWLGGTLTNFGVIHRRVGYLRELRQMQTDGNVDKRPKKELSKLRKEQDKLEQTLGGIINMDKLPDVLLIVDVIHEAIAVKEANRLHIPVVAIVDSNGDPDYVDKVVPGNDDAMRSIKVLVDAFAAAIEEGRLQCPKAQAAIEAEAQAEKSETVEVKDAPAEDIVVQE